MTDHLHQRSAVETINSVLAACNLHMDEEKSPFAPPFTDEWDPFWQKISETDAAEEALQRLDKYAAHKHAIIRDFFGDQLRMVQEGEDIILLHSKNGQRLGAQSDLPFFIDELRLTKQEAYIRGQAKLMAGASKENVAVYALHNGTETPCRILAGDPSTYKHGMLKCPAVGFECHIPLRQMPKRTDIHFAVSINGLRCAVRKLLLGEFAALGNSFRYQYYAQNGWAFLRSHHTLHLQRANPLRRAYLECRFLAYLSYLALLKKQPSAPLFKACRLRVGCFLRSLVPSREIWLISDRYHKADDNGEALFRFLCEHQDPKIDPYFIVSKDSPDYQQLKAVGKVVSPDSPQFRKLLLRSRFLISSHADRFTVQPLREELEPYRDLFAGHDFIYLRHGISLSDMSHEINRTKQNMRLMVSTTRAEYTAVLNTPQYQCEDVVRLTGLPRHDRLFNDPQKIITIMPTWRKYLFNRRASADAQATPVDDFASTDFFQFYNNLLNHPRLLEAARRTGYTIRFMPHPLLFSTLHLFDHNEQVSFYSYDTKYRQVFAESNLIVTDYSSAVLDFAYLRKPVLYCHFDHDEFTSGKHTYTPGYFDYEKMGFGEVSYDLETLVDHLIAYMESGCQMKPEYVERANNFFAYNDKNNCRRIYEEIIKLR